MDTSRCLGFWAGTLLAGWAVVGGNAAALEAGDWVFRGGPAYVEPTGESDPVPGVPGGRVEADGAAALGFSFGYMLTDNWSLDLLASTPFRHDVDGKGSLASGGTVATAQHLPPTLSVLYYPQPNATVRPYAGLGVNYTIFLNEETRGPLAGLDMDLDNSLGPAANIGVDIDLNDGWFFNASVWYIDLETEAKVEGFQRFDVAIDPVVLLLGVGTVF